MAKRKLTNRERLDTANQWLLCDQCDVGERLCVTDDEPCNGLKPKLILPVWFLPVAILISIVASIVIVMSYQAN